jgi:hypothetical protein
MSRKRYNKIQLIEMLVEYERVYGEIPKMNAIQANPDFPSAQTFVNYFGSWNKALKAAGMRLNSAKSTRYSKEELIEYLKDLDDRLDRTPSYSDIDKDENTPSPSTYYKYFDTLRKAMELAGFELRPSNCAYSKGELLQYMLDAKLIYGYIPSSHEWKELCKGFPTQATYNNRFKDMSWSEITQLAEKYDSTNKTVAEILEEDD